MVLIEGIGDEVTLVLGSFLLIVVLLLAWLSTHTNDIPLIREVGVIVVELRQRHRNRQQNRTEQQEPQEVEISQSSREGHLNASETDTSNGSGSGTTCNDHRQDTNLLQSSSVESDILSSTSHPSLSHSEEQQQQHQQHSEGIEIRGSIHTASSENSGNSESRDDIVASLQHSSTPPAEEPVIIPSQSSAPSYLSQETAEETLRRRRVEYFQTGIESSTSSVGSSDQRVGGDNKNDFQRLDNVHSAINTTNINNKDTVTPIRASDCDNDYDSRKAETAVEPLLSLPSHSESERLHRHSATTPSATGSNKNSAERDPHTPTLQKVQQSDVDGSGDDQHQENNEEGEIGSDGVDDGFLEGSRIRVKLKYMNETQRFVYASPGDTIGDFRRAHFQSELQDNKWVRFIFNGQDLRDDARTLQACNIENNCTMHCLVTTHQRPGDRQGEAVVEEEEESILGAMMYPLFTVMLLIVWYFRIFYRQYFSAMSTVCLIGISFLLGLSYVSSLRNVNEANAAANGQQQPPQPPQAAASGANHPHSD